MRLIVTAAQVAAFVSRYTAPILDKLESNVLEGQFPGSRALALKYGFTHQEVVDVIKAHGDELAAKLCEHANQYCRSLSALSFLASALAYRSVDPTRIAAEVRRALGTETQTIDEDEDEVFLDLGGEI
ncbi:MAG TPA: hypothetical protein VGK73_38720 [Polyangiaceae bacterium]